MAAIGVVVLASGTYALAPHNRRQMERLYGSELLSFTGYEFLLAASSLYALLLVLYHGIASIEGPTKSQRFFRVAGDFLRAPVERIRQGLSAEDRVAVLATVLKAFFGPMMLMSLMIFFVGAIANGAAVVSQAAAEARLMDLFNDHGFWLAMQVILFVDVLIFTAGYLVESPRLGNEIRSVDPTVLGWTAALLCYPPFNYVTSAVLGSQVSDFPQFDSPTVHVALNVALLALMSVYAWASVAMGWKASNLTHRGIVCRGPYRVIRHPAYVCKNVAWWIASIPLVSVAFAASWSEGLLAVASVVGWSMLYVLRALTEEDHMRAVDDGYSRYAAKVRYRFVPGVY